MKKRRIFIGDVHGMYDLLTRLLAEISYDKKKDQLYFVGDLINRGPKSFEVLELAHKEKAICVKGNHELAFLRYIEGKMIEQHQIFDELKKKLLVRPEIFEWLKSLPLFHKEEDLIMVHAGLSPGKKLKEQDPRVLTTIRSWDGKGEDLQSSENPPWHQLYSSEKTVIYGHWAMQGLHLTEKTKGLDSGAVYGNPLTAYLFDEDKIIQVNE